MKLFSPFRRHTDVQRSFALLTLGVVMLAACSNGGQTTATPALGTTTSSSTTTTTAGTTTTTTTTVPTTTTSSVPSDAGLPLLEDGRPATWVGVTSDYEAVEVDTTTGEVIRSLGQVSTAEDVATAECSACVNAIDAVWRTYDGSYILISECCEPAAGLIHVLTEDQIPLDLASDRDRPWFFWSAAPAPDSLQIAFLGYQVLVTAADTEQADIQPSQEVGDTETSVMAELDRFPVSNAVWVPGANEIRWLEADAGTVFLRTFDTTDGSSAAVAIEELADWNLASLAIRSSGDLLVARSDPDGAASSVLILTAEGEVSGEIPISQGARLGGYERTGTHLIYTDADGVVRWMSDDDRGVLAEGFIHASW